MQTFSLARWASILGMLMAVGPFAIDMYLPGFANIAESFGTTEGTVQLSLVSFFVALALGQVIYGPISDMVGRKKPIYFGLTLFVIASIGCAFAPTIEALIALRFVQGLGGCAGTVITLAVIRDLKTGAEAAKLMSLTLLGLSLSPILAPVAGGALVSVASWHAIFIALAVIGAAILALVAFQLPETHPPERRISARVGPMLITYARLLGNGYFVTAVLTAGFAQATLFAYIAGSPFVFITLHGLSPFAYSMVFAINAAAIIGGAQFNSFLIRRWGTPRLISTAMVAFVPASLLLCAIVMAGGATLELTVGFVFLTVACLGLILPTSTMLALEPFGANAGTASALSGAMQFTVSSTATFLVSASFDGSDRPMAGVMTLSAVCAALAWSGFLLISARRRRACPAE